MKATGGRKVRLRNDHETQLRGSKGEVVILLCVRLDDNRALLLLLLLLALS
jgi:hypothetical protein